MVSKVLRTGGDTDQTGEGTKEFMWGDSVWDKGGLWSQATWVHSLAPESLVSIHKGNGAWFIISL